MVKKKRQGLPSDSGALNIVATPIGNLSDISPRARKVLAEAQAVFCEDTRMGAKLFGALEISPAPRFFRCDANTEQGEILTYVEHVVAGIRAGQSFALISDAGTPAISDPGAKLVRALRETDPSAPIIGIPGPSAVPTLLSISGFEGDSFGFFGFFPREEKHQRAEIARFRAQNWVRVGVWFESPQRVEDTFALIAELMPDARMIAAKELTKVFEKHYVGSVAAVAADVANEIATVGKKGEWCFAIEADQRGTGEKDGNFSVGDPADAGNPGEEAWTKALQCLKNAGVSVSESARQVSQVFGVQKRQAYDVALRLKG